MSFIIRAARQMMDDLQPMYEMAKRTGGGFTNLPPDRKALAAKARTLRRCLSPALRTRLSPMTCIVFVLENTSIPSEVRGTCQIFSAKWVRRWPFYSYRIGALTQHSVELGTDISCGHP
jgi:arginine N-succinyltransferase